MLIQTSTPGVTYVDDNDMKLPREAWYSVYPSPDSWSSQIVAVCDPLVIVSTNPVPVVSTVPPLHGWRCRRTQPRALSVFGRQVESGKRPLLAQPRRATPWQVPTFR